jgi:hypothetical protein
MSKPRLLGAGNAGASTKIRLNGNVGGGPMKQGLPPLTNMPSKLHNKVRIQSHRHSYLMTWGRSKNNRLPTY